MIQTYRLSTTGYNCSAFGIRKAFTFGPEVRCSIECPTTLAYIETSCYVLLSYFGLDGIQEL